MTVKKLGGAWSVVMCAIATGIELRWSRAEVLRRKTLSEEFAHSEFSVISGYPRSLPGITAVEPLLLYPICANLGRTFAQPLG